MAAIGDLEERTGRLSALGGDLALTTLLAVIAVVTVMTQELVSGLRKPGFAAVLLAVAATSPVLVRRRWPLPAVAVSGVLLVIHVMVGYPEGSLPISYGVLVYSVALCAPLAPAVAGLGSMVASLLILGGSGAPGLEGVDVAGFIAAYAVVWATGLAVRSRRDAAEAQVRAAIERAEVERQRSARAVAEERLRIAQELHDVVAHSMSVIAVQAAVGRHLIDEQPAQAAASLGAISDTSRSVLAELRRLLGVLRDADGERSHTPAPTLADLPLLIDEVSALGIHVDLSVSGAPAAGHAGVELSAYRIVQEALTNVIKHAGVTSAVVVALDHHADRLEIAVVDDGRGVAADVPTTGGHGILGMRERVDLWGGELVCGPAPGGGFAVRASLPIGEAP